MFYIKNKPNFSDKILEEFTNKGVPKSHLYGIEDINSKISANPTIATKVFKTLCKILHDKVCDFDIPPQLTIKSSTNDSNFIGREDELKVIDEMLENPNSLLLIKGMGGIGKSSLVNHYLYTREKSFAYYGFVDGLDSFISEFRTSLELKAEKENELYNEIFYKLQNLTGTKLLVIDKVEDIDSHKELIEMILSLEKYDYKILFASRRKIKSITSYPLGTLLREDAQKLFLSYFKTDKIEKVDKIIEYLGRHTLFIKLVAETIENEGYTLDDIIEKFENKNGGLSKIEYIDEESGDEVTFNQNLQELFSMQNLKDEYVLLLKRLSVLPSIDIELSFLEEILGKERLKGRLNFLVARGWLIENDGSYKLHQIIKVFLLANYPPCFEEIEIILESFSKFIADSDDILVALNNQDNLIYFDCLLTSLERQKIKNKKIGKFYSDIANICRFLGLYKKSESFYIKDLKITKELFGENHKNLAVTYSNLAGLYEAMGIYKNAKSFHLKALKIRKNIFGENHSDTATSYNNLAILYEAIGKYENAESLYIRALKINEEVLEKNHNNTLFTYSNLAELYKLMKKYKKAELLNLKVLKIFENILGKDHPNTAVSYDNLANLYVLMGEYKKAEPLNLKALKIWENVFGDKHINTATCYNNLASLYQSIQLYEKAEVFYLKALKINKNVLGENHPYTASSYNNLANLYFHKEALNKAYKYIKLAVIIRERILPSNHSHLIESKKDLKLIESTLKSVKNKNENL